MNSRSNNAVLLSYSYALNDPHQTQTVGTLAQSGWKVTVLHPAPHGVFPSPPPAGVESHTYAGFTLAPKRPAALNRILHWIGYKRFVRNEIATLNPNLVMTNMLYALSALPKKKNFHLISLIVDIPSLPDCGKHGYYVTRKGWKRLREADLVWASDKYKAQLTQKYADLPDLPLVCHNCPPLDYLPVPVWPRDRWLRNELRRQGASIGENGGCILARVGAVGDYCGLEATLEAMLELPDDFVFVMMGRPSVAYKNSLLSNITRLKLSKRAFFWELPSDEVWKKSLLGADIGHMIQGPFPPGAPTRLYELNSSLSNYRLFQYMAAALPILAYDDPRMNELFAEVPCFRVLRLENLKHDTLAACVELSQDATLRQKIGIVGRDAHVRKYNWTTQFNPVLDKILTL